MSYKYCILHKVTQTHAQHAALIQCVIQGSWEKEHRHTSEHMAPTAPAKLFFTANNLLFSQSAIRLERSLWLPEGNSHSEAEKSISWSVSQWQMAFSQALANLAPLLEHQLIAEVVTIMKEVTTNLLSIWSESVIVRENKVQGRNLLKLCSEKFGRQTELDCLLFRQTYKTLL